MTTVRQGLNAEGILRDVRGIHKGGESIEKDQKMQDPGEPRRGMPTITSAWRRCGMEVLGEVLRLSSRMYQLGGPQGCSEHSFKGAGASEPERSS